MVKILTLEDFNRSGGSPTEGLVYREWPVWAVDRRRPEGFADSPVAFAEVNHGRWIVHCPMGGCMGAQMASRSEHRFFCVDCLHQRVEQAHWRWLRVEWPEELDAIESALRVRPVENRNWIVGEHPRVLLAENAAFLGDEHLKALML